MTNVKHTKKSKLVPLILEGLFAISLISPEFKSKETFEWMNLKRG
jgi:hypothetical protein